MSGEDVEFIKAFVQGTDLCGFTEYASVKHYINKDKLTMKWMFRRVYSEGITQWYKYGKKDFICNFMQLPLKIVALIGSLITFSPIIIGKRFFKVIHCAGVISGPFLISRKSNFL